MSWHQYLLMVDGYWTKNNREWEEGWRQTREVFWLLHSVNSTKANQKSRHALMPLPSDPKPKKKKMTPEQEHELFFAMLSPFKAN